MADKICPECGTRQENSSKFCKNCGIQFSDENENKNSNIIKCGNCGAELNNEMYCPDCGKATGIKICPKCSQKSVNENFCTSCGYRLNPNVKKCNSCGNSIDINAKICPNCGSRSVYKNPVVALVLSLIFPGLGQLYNNQNRKGLTLIIANVISYILCFILVGFLLVFLIWIYGMYDAFVTAKALNKGESLEDRIF